MLHIETILQTYCIPIELIEFAFEKNINVKFKLNIER